MGFQNKAWESGFELVISFEVVNPGQGSYRRPYIAVFVEDTHGKPVRTLELWYQRGRGVRWLRNLRSWYRGEVSRMQRDGGDLASTMSGPTRQPGTYSVIWDGKNDAGKVVEQGDYVVVLEVVREHGTYQLERKTLALTNKPVKVDLLENAELKHGTIEFRKKR